MILRPEIQQIIQRIIDNDSTLTKLDLKHQQLSQEESLSILQALESNNQIVELGYLDNDSSIQEVYLAMSRMLKVNTSIEILFLGTNKLSNAALDLIIEGIIDHPSLVTLDLNSNPFNDERAICTLINANTPLRKIDLTNSQISEKGFSNIKEAMKNNTNLTALMFITL